MDSTVVFASDLVYVKISPAAAIRDKIIGFWVAWEMIVQ